MRRKEAVTAVPENPFSVHSSSQNRNSKISLIISKIIIQIIIFSVVIISTLEVLKILFTNSYFLVLLAYSLFHKICWIILTQDLRNLVNSELSKNYFLYSFINRVCLQYQIYKYTSIKDFHRKYQVDIDVNSTDHSNYSSISLLSTNSTNLSKIEESSLQPLKSNSTSVVNKFKKLQRKYNCNNHTFRHLPGAHRIIHMSQNNSMLPFLTQGREEEKGIMTRHKNKKNAQRSLNSNIEYNTNQKEDNSTDPNKCDTEEDIKHNKGKLTASCKVINTFKDIPAIVTNVSSNSDNNPKDVTECESGEANENTQNVNLSNGVEDITSQLQLMNPTDIAPRSPLVTHTAIYASPSQHNDTNPMIEQSKSNYKRAKEEVSPSSSASPDVDLTSSGSFTKVTHKNKKKRKKEEFTPKLGSPPKDDSAIYTAKQQSFTEKLQQLKGRVFDVGRHVAVSSTCRTAAAPPEETSHIQLIRSRHIILSGFHGAASYNDNEKRDSIRSEVDKAVNLIGFQDAVSSRDQHSVPITLDNYRSGVYVNWESGITVLPQLACFSVLVELKQPVWVSTYGITDIDILPMTGTLYTQSNIAKSFRRYRPTKQAMIRQYRFQFLSDRIQHVSHLSSTQTKTMCSFRSVSEEPAAQVSYTIAALARKLEEAVPTCKHGTDYYLLHDRILHTWRTKKQTTRRDFETIIRLIIPNPTSRPHVANATQKALDKFIWESSQHTKDVAKLNIYGLKLEGLRKDEHLVHDCYAPIHKFIPHSTHITQGNNFSYIPLPNGGRRFSSYNLLHDFMISTKTAHLMIPPQSGKVSTPNIGSIFIQPPQGNHSESNLRNNWCAVIVWNEVADLDVSVLDDIYGRHYPKWKAIVVSQLPRGMKYVEEVLPSIGKSKSDIKKAQSQIERVGARSSDHDIELRQTLSELVDKFNDQSTEIAELAATSQRQAVKIQQLTAVTQTQDQKLGELTAALAAVTMRTEGLELRFQSIETCMNYVKDQLDNVPAVTAQITAQIVKDSLEAQTQQIIKAITSAETAKDSDG